MRTSNMLRLTSRSDQNVKRISLEESARIARLNPGPGIPLSMLPLDLQQRLQDGGVVSLKDLDIDILSTSRVDRVSGA